MSREAPPPGEEAAPEGAGGGGGGDGGEDGCYLALCARPVHFEKANAVNCVFFDEANKQVGAAPGLSCAGVASWRVAAFRVPAVLGSEVEAAASGCWRCPAAVWARLVPSPGP